MKLLKKWSVQELNAIKKAVESSPGNITLACEKVGAQFGRSPKAVEQKWYRLLRKDNQEVFSTSSKRTHHTNSKNVDRKTIQSKDDTIRVLGKTYLDTRSNTQLIEIINNYVNMEEVLSDLLVHNNGNK